ncbi:hypothetical protein EZ449_07810 [Pedobacter frigidisoli]|uniref:histidine kinase n=1 Tax=Pedobacter frigidisoli TaxID=2530455 RepID=A0A4R0P4U9_9SPHI|nr:two-component regulator propeller domain-containing protein [Pedobacter frigidisoli]TCD10784.1 hypothetical protein EZ449_07810 [Pedobacter frigidisoli]
MIFFFLYKPVHGQNYVKLNTFNTDQGLPSNHIYDIVEDNRGFLWITTDNGISRFDGKYFQNFSVRQGLPSNEVLQVLRDKDGIIWVNCFKQLPAYFDEVSNKFITINSNEILNEISKSLLRTTITADGNAKFFNLLGTVTFKNKKPISANNVYSHEFIIAKQQLVLHTEGGLLKDNSYCEKLVITQGKKKLDSILFKTALKMQNYMVDNNNLFLFSSGNMGYRICLLSLKPFKYKIDTINLFSNNTLQKFTNGKLNIIGRNGKVSIFDRNSLKLQQKIDIGLATNCAYVDKYENLWIGTLDKGLIFYSRNTTKTIKTAENFINNNFLSIATSASGEVTAGNYYGEILQLKNKLISKKTIENVGRTTWIRKIIYAKNKTVAIHDMGYSVNFGATKRILTEKGQPAYVKTATLINDSLIMIGSNSGLIKLNTNTLKSSQVHHNGIEITLSLVKAGNSMYYIGQKGLYKYNLQTELSQFIPLDKNRSTEKFNTLAYAADGTLWASTASGKLLIFYKDKIISCIPESAGMPENINCILANKNRIWLGSKSGISIIDYCIKPSGATYSIKNLSKNDGLSSNNINDFSLYNDTIYAATENGITKIPANYRNKIFEIKPELTGVKINQEVVKTSNKYNLKSDQNNITLQFAGVELSGHFKNIQYAINNKTKWNDLDGNTLNIQLNNGENDIFVRARDVNNHISTQNLKIHFYIKTPFYKAIWFWASMAIFLSAIIFWFLSRRKLSIQRTMFEQQLALEQQRSNITADLHDDIGATLSSLQLNSAVASQLINKDIKQTQKILEKIENQAKSLADKIGDIIWSMKPGKDEFMTISSRIKNFANDILGATNINYKVQIDAVINKKLIDIHTRKNIVFITKEAINNVAKYSHATQATISIKVVNDLIYLNIIDNGVGFEVCKAAGNGLANIKKRAKELNGSFNIQSAEKKGTIIAVVIPLVP